MLSMQLQPLFAGLLNPFTIRTEAWIYNWLTPIWILGLGALVGFVAIGILWLVGYLGSQIEPLHRLSANPTTRAEITAEIEKTLEVFRAQS